ncbi:MAG: epoxyqueuosine reductase [Dethiobacter sp.]|nr:epoxyqueuosine reductase [Dethiobacter sp.]
MDSKILCQKVTELLIAAPENSFHGAYRFYGQPLVGFASATDPLFLDLKKPEIVGHLLRTPREWLPDAATVISFFLPFSEEVRRSNYPPGPASEQWMHARFKGEEFANQVRKFVIQTLIDAGGRAVAPAILPEFIADFTTCTSNWSERHAAYIAGLGTFSLNRGLITEQGMAGRFASVITSLFFDPSPRPYTHPFQNCPSTNDGKCGACIKRCPSGAIKPEGKDKYVCQQYLRVENPMKEFSVPFGYPYSACGKCQTGVPCEHRIPAN